MLIGLRSADSFLQVVDSFCVILRCTDRPGGFPWFWFLGLVYTFGLHVQKHINACKTNSLSKVTIAADFGKIVLYPNQRPRLTVLGAIYLRLATLEAIFTCRSRRSVV